MGKSQPGVLTAAAGGGSNSLLGGPLRMVIYPPAGVDSFIAFLTSASRAAFSWPAESNGVRTGEFEDARQMACADIPAKRLGKLATFKIALVI